MSEDNEPSIADLVKIVGELQRKNDALEAKVTDAAATVAGTIDYYQCNACGVHLENGKRCPQHPNEQVNGIGNVFNPVANTVRLGMVTRS